MTDDEHRALAKASQQMQLREAQWESQALLRRRTKWFWLAMSPILAGPLGWIGLNRFYTPLVSYFIDSFRPLLLALAALGWSGYCAGMITALNSRISGIPASVGQKTGVFVGLLVMNFLIGAALLFAGCMISLMVAGFRS